MYRARHLAFLASLGLAALLGACAAPSATATVDGHVTLVRGGFPEPLVAGTPIAAGGKVVAHATVLTVAGTQYARTLRLELERDGQPVEGATVASEGEMRYMTHGPVRALGRSGPVGTYLVALPIYMAGQWRVITDVTTSFGTGRIELEIDVFE